MPSDFTLIPARAYRVRGMVTGISVGQKAVVELVREAGPSLPQSHDVGPDGEFEVRGVGPGSYVARATVDADGQTLTARQDVKVVAADVDGIKLVLAPPFTVSGHLRIDGRPAAAITQYTVNLRAVDAREDSWVLPSRSRSRSCSAVRAAACPARPPRRAPSTPRPRNAEGAERLSRRRAIPQ